uniref:Phosphatidylinositol-glycan biosynthesis class W protein n=1 Tax=Steinernema glaseri TaxID=37863 RepID=A0A1I7ZPF6_9BILA
MASSPAEIREQFVTGHNGTNQLEVFAVQLVCPLAVLCRNLIIRWIFLGSAPFKNHAWSKFWIDFLLLVTPMLLSLTLMAEYVFLLVLCQIATVICVASCLICEYCVYNKEKPPFQQVVNQVIAPEMGPTMFFTYLRSMLMTYTCIAILAVDFPVFPRRFAKTETFGHSVMDIGAAAFVFVMGAAETIRLSRKDSQKTSLRSLVKSSRMTLVLVAIGMCRTIILPLLNYQLHVTEYGTHWNFFYTLAVIKAFSIMHSLICNGNFSMILGFALCGLHEYLLTGLGYKIWILSDAGRDTWVSANREGIFSILGYLALYCFGYRIGQIAAPSGCVRLKAYFWLTVKIFVLAGLFFLVQRFPLEHFFGAPSRRLMNLPFIFAMNGLFTWALAMFLVVQLVSLSGWAARIPSFHLEETAATNKLNPCILAAVNGKGFLVLFFLLSNIMTGAVNLSMDTIGVTNPLTATVIIGSYSATCLAAIFYMSTTTYSGAEKETEVPSTSLGRLLRLILS